MVKILIAGAGRVGMSVAQLLRFTTYHEIVLVDSRDVSDDALAGLRAIGDPAQPVRIIKADAVELDSIMEAEKPVLTFCTLPFNETVRVAQLCAKHSSHYIDFTEDMGVNGEISKLDVGSLTFASQTGLAPGLINYMGQELVAKLDEPHSLELFVGALPQVALEPHMYAITWSPEGLINEYLKRSTIKVNGAETTVQSLSDKRTINIKGMQLEAFYTAGGTGNLAAYDSVPNVSYRTVRYPGHHAFISKLLYESDYKFERAVAAAKSQIPTSRQDIVVMAAVAISKSGHSIAAHHVFSGIDKGGLKLTALELTTAGTGVAVADLIIRGALPAGVITSKAIPLDLVKRTRVGKLVFESLLP